MITNEPYTTERQLFGHAIACSPTELAHEFSHKPVDALPNVVTTAVVRSATVSESDLEIATPFLESGIRDMIKFYGCVLKDDIDSEHRALIAKHPKTVKRLVELALHSASDIELPRVQKNYVLSEDERYITVSQLVLLRPNEGCPFAGNNEPGQVDPLFKKFARWTTDLIFTHHEIYSQQKANTTDQTLRLLTNMI